MEVPKENRHGIHPSTIKAIHNIHENSTTKIKTENKLSTGFLVTNIYSKDVYHLHYLRHIWKLNFRTVKEGVIVWVHPSETKLFTPSILQQTTNW
jgi:hypothetical protein